MSKLRYDQPGADTRAVTVAAVVGQRPPCRSGFRWTAPVLLGDPAGMGT